MEKKESFPPVPFLQENIYAHMMQETRREKIEAELLDIVHHEEREKSSLRVLILLNARVQNIVSNLRLQIPVIPEHVNIDVKNVTRRTKQEGSKYNDSRFRAFRRGFFDPSGGVHMFRGMGTIVTGTQNPLVAEYLTNTFIDSMRKCSSLRSAMSYIRVEEDSQTQVNIVCNMSLPFCVNLENLSLCLSEFQQRRQSESSGVPYKEMTIQYNPRNFIGAILKVHPKATILVFREGSMVTTGRRTIELTRDLVIYALPLLFMCKM